MSLLESAARSPEEFPFIAEIVADLCDEARKLVYAD